MANNVNEKMYDLMAKYLSRKDVRRALFAGKIKALLFKSKKRLIKKLGLDKKGGAK